MEVKGHLNSDIKDVLFKDAKTPSSTSRYYFLKQKDVMNHVYICFVKNKLEIITQENFISTIEQWRQIKSEIDEGFFQPYSSDGQQLMFVQQSAWQRPATYKYGNELALLDATYKTTKYAFLLFFVAVKTNVDYQVVTSFPVQNEKQDTLIKALEIKDRQE